MKRFIPLIAFAMLIIGTTVPAEAKTIMKKSYTVRHTKAPVPCAAVCAYWLEEANNKDAGIYFNACRAPFPTGSYTDIVVRAPRYSNFLKVVAYPLLDWDTFMCSKPSRGNNGTLLAQGANSATDTDGCTFGMGLGCIERMNIRVREGRYYVLRSYNWSDAADMPVRLYWLRI